MALVIPDEINKVVYDKMEFTYDADKDITSIKYYKDNALILTLTFTYDADKDITSITKS